jgi:hypothetical protein
MWEDKKVYRNVITVALKMLELAKQIRWEWKISRSLERIQLALEEGAKCSVEEIREITNLINSLPPEFTLAVQKIQALIMA